MMLTRMIGVLFVLPFVSTAGYGEEAARPDLDVSISIQAPASNYAIRITGVYHVGNEIWAVSQVRQVGDFGASVITTLTDSARIADENVPKGPNDVNLAVKHKVLGKTWNWGKNTADVEYVTKKGEAQLQATLGKAKKLPIKGR
jgi:hypothetical protein